eukprot:g7977.t1
MASLTTNQTPAKRERTTNKSTLEALQQERAPPPIKIGILVLPAGFESACGIMTKILLYLDIKTLCNVKRSSLIQQCRKAYGCDDFERVRDEALSNDYKGRRSIDEMILSHPARRLYLLIKRYKTEFPRCTPFVCACAQGHMDDVQSFMTLHPYHKYITNRDVRFYKDDMTLKEYVDEEGKTRYGGEYTPLMISAKHEHFQVVKYLIEQGEADPNIANCDGWNALHLAVETNRTTTETFWHAMDMKFQRFLKEYRELRIHCNERSHLGVCPGATHAGAAHANARQNARGGRCLNNCTKGGKYALHDTLQNALVKALNGDNIKAVAIEAHPYSTETNRTDISISSAETPDEVLFYVDTTITNK